MEKSLKRESLSARRAAEAMLVFEAIYSDIIEQGPGSFLLNLVNVTGDIVTVATLDADDKRKEAAS